MSQAAKNFGMRAALGALLAAGLLLAVPAAAQDWTVELHSGAEFRTFYQPREAAWDDTMVVFMSDAGNWVALPKDDISEVYSQRERLGFGKMLDSKTVQIGFLMNDQLTPEEQAALEESGGPRSELLDAIEALQGQQQNYDVEQFVDPGEAGSGGFPSSSIDDF